MLKGPRLGPQLDWLLMHAVWPFAYLPAEVSDAFCALLYRAATPFSRSGRWDQALIAAALACDPPTAHRIAERRAANTLRAQIDLARWIKWPSRCDKLVSEQDEVHLAAALASGRGAIVVVPHMVGLYTVLWPWARLAEQRGIQGGAVAADGTWRAGAAPLYAPTRSSAHAPRAALAMLAEGGCVVVAGDRFMADSRRAVELQFLKSQCRFPVGPAALARLAQAPLIPAIPLRLDHGRYVVRFLPALAPPAPGDRVGDELVLARIIAIFEATIRRHPDQYALYPHVRQAGHTTPRPDSAALPRELQYADA